MLTDGWQPKVHFVLDCLTVCFCDRMLKCSVKLVLQHYQYTDHFRHYRLPTDPTLPTSADPYWILMSYSDLYWQLMTPSPSPEWSQTSFRQLSSVSRTLRWLWLRGMTPLSLMTPRAPLSSGMTPGRSHWWQAMSGQVTGSTAGRSLGIYNDGAHMMEFMFWVDGFVYVSIFWFCLFFLRYFIYNKTQCCHMFPHCSKRSF